MNVLLTKKFMPVDLDYLRSGLNDAISLLEPDEYTEKAVVEKIPDAQVLLGGMITEAVIEAAGHIKLFQIPWTGVDTVDFTLLEKYSIDCVCNSHSNGMVVAEHAIALYASVAKKITYHDSQLRNGNWNRISPEGNEVSPFSRSLNSQKVVFVGYGAVNRGVHKLLRGFEPHVTVVNRSGVLEDATGVEEVLNFRQIAGALNGADAVFIALPLTEKTQGLFNSECFNALDEKAIVVNVARGSVVEEKALFDALSKEQIYGAGIDTWYNYPKPGESMDTPPSQKYSFRELKNIVMSPHRSGYVDSGFPHLDDAIANINSLYEDKPLSNLLSVEHRY